MSALDYLLKPLNIDDLKAAVQKAEQQAATQQQHKLMMNLLQNIGPQKDVQQQKLGLPMLHETRLVTIADIVRCESSNSYTTFFLTGGEKLVVSRPIKEYEELLNSYGFIRVHQSHLVNKEQIKSLLRSEGNTLLLKDGSSIPLSRQKKDEVIKLLKLL